MAHRRCCQIIKLSARYSTFYLPFLLALIADYGLALRLGAFDAVVRAVTSQPMPDLHSSTPNDPDDAFPDYSGFATTPRVVVITRRPYMYATSPTHRILQNHS